MIHLLLGLGTHLIQVLPRAERSVPSLSRLDIKTPDRAQMVVEQLYHDMERRIAASPPGLCPVDMALNFLNLCHAQTCGKCVPCRVGLAQLSILLTDVLEGRAKPSHMKLIEDTARELQTYHTLFYTGHCTGKPAQERLLALMGDQLRPLHSGQELCLP